MKDLVERIYEGFYGSVVKFDNTPERVHYYTISRKMYEKEWETEYRKVDSNGFVTIDWNAVETDIKNYNIVKSDRLYMF